MTKLGRAGYQFKDPAYCEYLGQPVNDGQPGLQLRVVSERDYNGLRAAEYGERPETKVLSAKPPHIRDVSEEHQLVLNAMLVLSKRELVITREPVSLAN